MCFFQHYCAYKRLYEEEKIYLYFIAKIYYEYDVCMLFN
jgi:hypothetical protein